MPNDQVALVTGATGTFGRAIATELGARGAALLPTGRRQLFWGAFHTTGQVCLAAKRVYLHADICQAFAEALTEIANTVTVGAGTDVGVQLGPVQNRPQYERVLDLIRDARDHGYRFLTGGLPEDQKGVFRVADAHRQSARGCPHRCRRTVRAGVAAVEVRRHR